jgi:hypothetical protein
MPSPNQTDTFSDPELREEVLSQADALSLSLTDERIVEIIGRRVENSENFWNEKLNLKNVRDQNEQRWLNNNFEIGGNALYGHQVPYKDNRIFVSVETLAASIVSRIPQPEVIEAQDTDASRELAQNYAKVLEQTAKDNYMKSHLQMIARHLLMGYRLGVMKCSWDFNGGRMKDDGTFIGDVAINFVRPHKIIIDAEAEDPDNVPLIAESLSKTVEELGYQFPDKKDKLMEIVGKGSGERVNMGSRLGYKEIWFTFYDDKGNKQEGLCWKYDWLILDKGINPNYNYDTSSKTNFLEKPVKPYILFNFLRMGKYVFDDTSLTEQAANLQDVLEKRGRQMVESADQSTSTKIFNTMQIDAGDAAKYVGDPRQNILVKGDVRTAFARIAPEQLGRQVIEDKLDARQEIDNIFGTHAPLRGERTNSPTLGQEQLSQRSDLGRTAMLIESMENGAVKAYRLITQLYKVFAKEEHMRRYVGAEGQTTFINFSGDKIEDGVEIFVNAGSMQPQDKLEDRNEAVELAKIGGRIDPLSFAEKWHVDKPREFATRLFYFLFMPDKYAQEVLKIGQSGGDQDAMSAIQRLSAGENVPPPQNPSKEYIAYFGQFIKSPAFKQVSPEGQALILEHIKATVAAAKQGLSGQPAQPAQSPEGLPPESGVPSQVGQSPQQQPQGQGNVIQKMLGYFRQ